VRRRHGAAFDPAEPTERKDLESAAAAAGDAVSDARDDNDDDDDDDDDAHREAVNSAGAREGSASPRK